MTYKINGNEFTIPPTTGRWLPREEYGRDGNGHPIYPPVREFEMTWQLIDPTQANQLQGFFNAVNVTGSAVVDLPRYAHSTYEFYSYTGCVVPEPDFGEYFTEYHSNVSLIISRIRT